MFALYELVTRRKPNEKFVNVLTRGFMYLLIAAMLFLVYRDSLRSWRIHRAAKAAAAVSVEDKQ
jgi:membrane-associated protease RseP (regulator of RpoE activity)